MKYAAQKRGKAELSRRAYIPSVSRLHTPGNEIKKKIGEDARRERRYGGAAETRGDIDKGARRVCDLAEGYESGGIKCGG